MTNAFTAKPKLDPQFLKDIKISRIKQQAGQARSRQPGSAKTFTEKAAERTKREL